MGTLKIEQLPWTQPAFAPLYPAESFPVVTRERWHVLVAFETDKEFIQSQLPVGVEPASTPPVAAVWCATHTHSTMGGPYREAGAGVTVTFEGKKYFYPLVVYLGANSEEWFAAGREVWGHQKKLGHPWIAEPEGSGIVTGFFERPKGTRLMEVTVGPLEREATVDEIAFLPVLSLRIIPHPEQPRPQVAELIVTEAQLTPRRGSDGHLEFWAGPGEVAYPVRSDRDPLHRLTVRRTVAGYYGCFEGIITPFGKIVKRLV
ncbi:MAG: acetoacetate decarboxylase family protein [Acidobacteria bacterium]|nr:acetoacetate decarboxylase family protein [Acidobacteriota bacterium]